MKRLNDSFTICLIPQSKPGAKQICEVKSLQERIKISLAAIVMITAIIGLAVSVPAIFAQSTGGQYDPQTQFPVGTQLTFASFNGLSGQVVGFNTTTERNILAAYPASTTIKAQVDKLTIDGGIHWTVTGGSFVINGQTYTITGGDGHMGAYDRVSSGMDGYATGPNGQTYHWHLAGLSGIQSGNSVIVNLSGRLATVQNGAITAYYLGFLCSMS
jgi:hypothetical protein